MGFFDKTRQWASNMMPDTQYTGTLKDIIDESSMFDSPLLLRPSSVDFYVLDGSRGTSITSYSSHRVGTFISFVTDPDQPPLTPERLSQFLQEFPHYYTPIGFIFEWASSYEAAPERTWLTPAPEWNAYFDSDEPNVLVVSHMYEKWQWEEKLLAGRRALG